jgi:NADH:ubiquinone oxidoreductase subunit 6 (subunit J)
MTVNAVAFYAVAALIVLAAAAAVGLTSLRLAGYAGGATVVLIATLELVSGAYALAAVQVVVPGVAAAVVFWVLRRDEYRGLGATSVARARWWLGGPVAVGIAAMVIVTVVAVGAGAWSRISPATGVLLPAVYQTGAALITVLHYRAPYALAISAVLVVLTVLAGLVIGRRSGDEHALDQHTRLRREREARAQRRREDREQGRRRSREEA